MKKTVSIVAGLLLCGVSAHTSLAADGDIATSAPGAQVTITTSTAGAQPVVFNPSTNVNILGTSSETAFLVAAWHQQAVGKDSGQAYAMASDSNKQYFLDISANGVAVPTTSYGTNIAALPDDWNTM